MKIGYKTKPRTEIMEYLKENADRRFTARDILNALKSDGDGLDRSTVYRNLERLCKDGKLVKYKESDVNATCYQYSENHGSCREHVHAECTGCGKIFHLDNIIFSDAASKMKKNYGIEIDYGKTVIMCLCNECRVNPQQDLTVSINACT
ncbi:Fur family transcriptional regulator [Oribacterium sp. WCC10]|uniref:Fur family transcriptional regulator n=1 Tax=Oribacterium sp. WCC10 TaxID=1855343 RepID=UPI0008E944C6|nr:transcriptional repressor [Oribacterium sp. WCC10]SFG76893.1 Fur family transcriptional regulator, ferric uptake regulator [Oribacterium sp. WCC10]